jgi:hypothetical protein
MKILRLHFIVLLSWEFEWPLIFSCKFLQASDLYDRLLTEHLKELSQTGNREHWQQIWVWPMLECMMGNNTQQRTFVIEVHMSWIPLKCIVLGRLVIVSPDAHSGDILYSSTIFCFFTVHTPKATKNREGYPTVHDIYHL